MGLYTFVHKYVKKNFMQLFNYFRAPAGTRSPAGFGYVPCRQRRGRGSFAVGAARPVAELAAVCVQGVKHNIK